MNKSLRKTFILALALVGSNLQANAVTEKEFNNVLSRIHSLYNSIVKTYGVELVVDANWADTKENAYSTREEGRWVLHVPGGIARAKDMTTDSFALVVCHELGHQLGGAPRMHLYGGWPSAEGQSDYWASSKCLKKYYSSLSNQEISASANIPEKVIADCSSVYLNIAEQKVCVKTVLASLDFARFLNSLPDAKYVVSLETPDPKVVKGTNINDYPRPQCRFDTLYQGALCPISFNVLNSEKDPDIGNCNDYTKLGARPRCWFKPD